MGAFPSLPLFTDAYIADTAHLTCEEHGAYLRLLMFAWRSPGCRLPDDDARLARMLGLTIKRWGSIKSSVMAFWSLEDGHWVQKRLSREHQFVSEKVEKKRASGRLGGRPKSLENNDQVKANGSEIEKRIGSEPKAPTPTPTYTPVVPKGTKDAEPEGFAEWFAAYPKRDGANPRAPAASRYASTIKAGIPSETLLRAVRAYAKECERKGKIGTEYVKQAQYWLSAKDRLWEHYAAQPEAAKPRGEGPDEYLASLSDDRWRDEVNRWRARLGYWPLRTRTPPPDDPATAVPKHILAEMNLLPDRARAA